MFRFSRKKKYKDYDFNPDEIFLDTVNVSNLNKQQFEGVIEKPIKSWVVKTFVLFCIVIFIVFSIKLFSLQVIHTDQYLARSQSNLLRKKPIFSQRGLIYDRNGIELAWNKEGDVQQKYLDRIYSQFKGFGHVLGYVSYPVKDKNGYYWRDNLEGKTGIEERYNDMLSGNNGAYLSEVNALGDVLSKGGVDSPTNGGNVSLTIDAKIQDSLYRAVEKQALDGEFVGAAAAIMDINTGELVSMLSYPEIDVQVFADASDSAKINKFLNDDRKPFLNRVVSGLYSPGSIVKPFIALSALHEGIIAKNTIIESVGRIEIANPYNPSKPSVYRDWRREGHGPTDVTFAIADSVNTFFYAISGGYQDQKGLGILTMKKYLEEFGFGKKTNVDFAREQSGVIPDPNWKKKIYDDDWRLGDTYITSIGQFGFQVSPIQMLRSVSALANNGKFKKPYIVKGGQSDLEESVTSKIEAENYELIQKGMRDTVLLGTAKNVDVDFVSIAAKTGTAQVGVKNEFYHSWSLGFFPYEKPQYGYVIVMEEGNRGGSGSASRALKDFIFDVEDTYPEFWDSL